MTERALASAELREVLENRLVPGNRRTYPLAPFLDGEARERYIYYKNRYESIREIVDGDLPQTFEESRYCKQMVAAHGADLAARAVRDGLLETLSFLTGLTNREVDLSEARTLMRLLDRMRRPGYVGLFVGHTDAGKTTSALWLALLLLLDDEQKHLATNIGSLEWAEPELNERTHLVESKSELKAAAKEHAHTVAVLDELSTQANAQTANYDVNAEFYEMLTFKSKYGLSLFPIFHRTDGKDAAPAFREHATHFLKQEREENELGDDEYTARFFQEYDDGDFRNEEFAVPIPPLQPDGTFDPDETARFAITE